AHLASAFLLSPFSQAVTVSVDGFGDFASTSWGVGNGTKIKIDGRVYFPHSLGVFYQALTQYLGFLNYGDEYKVMGLAPYGEPKYLDEMRKIVLLQADGTFKLNLDYFCHHREGVDYRWEGGVPHVGLLFSGALEQLLGQARQPQDEISQKHKDLARSIQAMYEEAFFHLLNSLHKRYQLDCLALAGGCAMNSVANGKISLKTPFKQVYIQAAAGDAGGAIGAAFSFWHQMNPSAGRFEVKNGSWGESFSDVAIEHCIEASRGELEDQGCEISFISDDQKLCQKTASAIEQGKVIGWFQGRMEWGARALGNRSILGDPRRTDMKDILNLKIKRRESFRPFAPSILREKSKDWFERDDEVPFMEKVFQIRPEKRSLIPAVTHVDGSGRLQTVTEEANPIYHKLIQSFETLTGVPILLNTSFNENEPIVCKPKEALNCFLRTKMDVLVLGHFIIERKSS
ncbi:MAG TPA: carbamoyltransferase C-terminal domain-containing protein, partial [Candidatus Omnitrophota bacterium]|nr:carbamoyltransferase C-terminal domain-containing protein [Candidatus Omnitrophota bacterium]